LNSNSRNCHKFTCVFTEKTGKLGILVFEKMCTRVVKYIEKWARNTKKSFFHSIHSENFGQVFNIHSENFGHKYRKKWTISMVFEQGVEHEIPLGICWFMSIFDFHIKAEIRTKFGDSKF
jgi:hypothetical protein